MSNFATVRCFFSQLDFFDCLSDGYSVLVPNPLIHGMWPAVGIWAARELIIHNTSQKNPAAKKTHCNFRAVWPGILHWGWSLGRNMMVADVRNKKFRVRRHLNQKIPANLQTVTIWKISGHFGEKINANQ